MFVTDLLEKHKNNGKTALKHGSKELSYSNWNSYAHKLSCKINELIPSNSINIALFMPNSIEYAVAYFAVLFSQKVVVPIGSQSKSLEVTSTLEYCEVDLIISTLNFRDYLIQNLKSYKYKISLLFIDDQSVEFINKNLEAIDKTKSTANKDEEDTALLLHTSGTTNNPKRVMLTHKNLISNVESNIASLRLTSNDKVLIALPMHFGYCNTAQFLTHLYLGASMVIMDTMFLPKQFFQIVEKEQITNFTGVPSMLLMLLDYRYSFRYDYSSLRYICFGGGRMPIEKLKHLIERYNSVGFVQTYGQTECSPRITALLPQDSLIKIGSVGKPIPNVEILIIDENGTIVPSLRTGEIIVKGNNVMKGYYKQPEITNETIRNAWLHTGDLGYLDGDGYLYLTGRIKNIIISGGINIYPEEIEQILLQHECVDDV